MKYPLSIILLLVGLSAFAQREHDESDLRKIAKKEKELLAIGDSMLEGSNQMVRIAALQKFVPKLIETLKIPGSFVYNFDSMRYVFTFTPPDKRFRLYNWNLKFDDGTFRFYGVIQMNNEDSLHLIPLYDRPNDRLINKEDTILGQDSWYGAQYYQLVQKEMNEKTYYFFMGWDGYKPTSNRRLIEVLHFNDKEEPILGAPLFLKDGMSKTRLIFEFKEQATMFLRYDNKKDKIVFDHLVPPNPRAKGKFFTYIPDGTYESYTWDSKRGKWVYDKYLFDESEEAPSGDADRN